MKEKKELKKIKLIDLNNREMEKINGGKFVPNCSAVGGSTDDCNKSGMCDGDHAA